jgi:hypothetical protein
LSITQGPVSVAPCPNPNITIRNLFITAAARAAAHLPRTAQRCSFMITIRPRTSHARRSGVVAPPGSAARKSCRNGVCSRCATSSNGCRYCPGRQPTSSPGVTHTQNALSQTSRARPCSASTGQRLARGAASASAYTRLSPSCQHRWESQQCTSSLLTPPYPPMRPYHAVVSGETQTRSTGRFPSTPLVLMLAGGRQGTS